MLDIEEDNPDEHVGIKCPLCAGTKIVNHKLKNQHGFTLQVVNCWFCNSGEMTDDQKIDYTAKFLAQEMEKDLNYQDMIDAYRQNS